MLDEARKQTDQRLEQMERRLTQIYKRAAKETGAAWKNYLAQVDKEIKPLTEAYNAAKRSGDKNEIRKAGRKLAAKQQEKTIMDRRYQNLTKQLAEDLSHVNEKAAAYINENTPEIYATNYNAMNKDISVAAPGYSFSLVDASTVKSLATRDETLLPYRYIDGKKDVRWNTQKINAEVLQGILQGESIPKIAARFTNVVGMNKASAIRNARTAVTSAENKGRIDMLHDAAANGVIAKKVWLATGDNRTRDAHRLLNGQEQEIDDPFKSELGDIMFPGDPAAAPANVYACRCTLKYRVVGFGKKQAQKEESYFEEDHSNDRQIYGKVDGMQYKVSADGTAHTEYSAREKQPDGEFITTHGIDKSIEISANPSDTEVIVQALPKSSGFTESGGYKADETSNTILTNGRIAVNYDTGNNDTRLRVKSMLENEIDILGGVRKDGVFYRVTENAKEASIIKSGKIRPSKNHMTGETEDGLSVWETPKYFGSYLEKITGEVVGLGSDGEPLLDVKTVKLVSVNEDEITKMREHGRTRFLNIYGWTEEQLDNALKGKYNILR